MLMHRQALVEFNATWQCSGTVQDLLIKLDKLAAHMVEAPNGYMLQAHFVEALHEPLWREVLRQEHSTEFSKMSELVFAAEQIEDVSCYDWGVRRMDALSSNTAAQMKPAPKRAWATYTPWPYAPQGQWPRAVANHGPLQTPQARPSVALNSASHPETGQTKPENSQPGGMTANWSETGGACLFWVWQSRPHPNKLPL